MQPRRREMQAMNSIFNQSEMSLQDQDLQNGQHQNNDPQIHDFDPATSHDDFLDQMLSTLPSSSWPYLAGASPKSPWDLSSNPLLAAAMIGSINSRDMASPDDVPQNQLPIDGDQWTVLASKLRQQQISGEGARSAAVKSLMLQQQLLLQSRGVIGGGLTGDSGLLPMPLSLGSGDDFVDDSPFESSPSSVLFVYSILETAPVLNQTTGQPRQRARARRGQATDPHSIAERLRRERIAERMKSLQELVPNANKTDKASMLDEIIDYVKFLQLQVKVLSLGRLGGTATIAPHVPDTSLEGGGDCIQVSGGGGKGGNGNSKDGNNIEGESMTVTEHQVAKLMEENMGSAMQYLQGKGLCLMPISLATAISTATCRSSVTPNEILNASFRGGGGSELGGPSSPGMSALTVQSAMMGNGGGTDASVKDATSVSKP